LQTNTLKIERLFSGHLMKLIIKISKSQKKKHESIRNFGIFILNILRNIVRKQLICS